MNKFLWPLAGFIALVILLGVGLNLNPRDVPSPLVGKPAASFSLPVLGTDRKFGPEEMKGKVWLLNVWASWCVSCRVEHPLLVELAGSGAVPIVGLNYKDKRDEALAWLAKHGDPYVVSIVDAQGLVGIDWGVYGVPETFVVDKQGVIRLKHVGPVTPEVLREQILPLVKKLDA